MPERKMVEVRRYKGRPCLFIHGKPTVYGAYWPQNFHSEDLSEVKRLKTEAVKVFAGIGIHQYEHVFPHGWAGPDRFDPASSGDSMFRMHLSIDQTMEAIVEGDPEAMVMVLFILRPPRWWRETHPDELERNEYGHSFGASAGSRVFRSDVCEAVGRAVAYMEQSPWRERIIGYNVWWVGSEGFTEGCLYNAVTDFSPAMTAAFRQWLGEKYGHESELRKAWRDDSVTFETAEVPTHEEQATSDFVNLLAPRLSRKVLDYYDCLGECMYQTWSAVLSAAKQACDRRVIVGTYGGYLQVTGWSPNYWGATGPAGVYQRYDRFPGFGKEEFHTHVLAGQTFWSRLLDHPDVDFLASPYDYYYRKWGAPFLNQAIGESAKLRGKLFIINEDTRSYLHDSTQYSRCEDLEEFRAVYRRNFAGIHTLTSGCNWMEQAQNWLKDPPVLEELKKFNEHLHEGIHWEREEPDAIAVIIDEESIKHQIPYIDIDWAAIYKSRVYGLAHCGVPFRFYTFADLEKDNFPDYKFYYFLNLYYIDEARLELIERKLKRNGRLLLWQWAAGAISAEGVGTDSMEKLTGIRFKMDKLRWEHMITICNWQHPITCDLPADCAYGTEQRYGPAFYVDDSDATTLGWLLLYQGRHENGLVVKEFGKGVRGDGAGQYGPGDYASVYTEAPLLPAALLRSIAAYAGCHVYNEQNDVIYAGDGILAVHAAKPGKRHLRLPRPAAVRELYTGELIGKDIRAFDYDFPEPGTAVFYLGDSSPSGQD